LTRPEIPASLIGKAAKEIVVMLLDKEPRLIERICDLKSLAWEIPAAG
jgi:hypothetical protein